MNKTQLAERISKEIEKRIDTAEAVGMVRTITIKMKTGVILEIKQVYGEHWHNGVCYPSERMHYEVTNTTTQEKRYFKSTDSLGKSMAYGYLG